MTNPTALPSETAFRDVYTELLKKGRKCSPRGQLVIELEHHTYELPAYARFPNFEGRKLSLDYIKREFLWYLRGNRMDASITKYAKIWADVQNEDGSINSNYGQYIFARRYTPDGGNRSPFERAVGELITDKDSRRASITILNNNHLDSKTKDVPCTYSLNFRIRDDKLNMSVNMRSQDAVFGMGNDAPCFSFIHEMMLEALKDTYPTISMGIYTHTADSFHVYERHFKLVQAIVDGAPYIPTECPFMNGIEEVRHLTFGIHSRYPLGVNAWCYDVLSQPREPLMNFEVPKVSTFDKFSFSNWLLEPELAEANTTPANGTPT